MIMIKRKLDQVIYLQPRSEDGLAPEIKQLFAYGPIGISIEEISKSGVTLGVCIPDELELVKKEDIK